MNWRNIRSASFKYHQEVLSVSTALLIFAFRSLMTRPDGLLVALFLVDLVCISEKNWLENTSTIYSDETVIIFSLLVKWWTCFQCIWLESIRFELVKEFISFVSTFDIFFLLVLLGILVDIDGCLIHRLKVLLMDFTEIWESLMN